MYSPHSALTGVAGRGSGAEEAFSPAVTARPAAHSATHAAAHVRRLIRIGLGIHASYERRVGLSQNRGFLVDEANDGARYRLVRQDALMAHIALFHSVLGLRSAELFAAERLRRAGHEVVTPDLFDGETASALDEGFELLDRIGWARVVKNARQALAGMPDQTVLAGVSMGTGVLADLWPERSATAGVLLLHAATDLPATVRPGVRVQLHAGEHDEFAPPERVAGLCRAAEESGVDLEVFRYPGVGHFYTDHELPDHAPAAAELTWRRVLDFLGEVDVQSQ